MKDENNRIRNGKVPKEQQILDRMNEILKENKELY